MNEDSLLITFEERLRRLPPKIKAVLDAPKTGDMIYQICIDYDVHDHVASYSSLIGMILMGNLNPNLLVKNIVEKEGLDVDTAKEMALDISAAILQPIKQELITMYGLVPKTQPQMASSESSETKPSTLNPIPYVPPPSTREAGVSLPELPQSEFVSKANKENLTAGESNTQSFAQNASVGDKVFYSPPTIPNIEQIPVSAKPKIIDLSKEPPRPVAQPGDLPLEGNVVNLKEINNRPNTP